MKILKMDEYGYTEEHTISEVICVKCSRRWIAVRPSVTKLKELECPDCGAGAVIETGQPLEAENCIDCEYENRGKCKLKLGEYSRYVACEYYKRRSK